MTEASHAAAPPVPGGAAKLAGRPVARIGYGVMQLERAEVGRQDALALLRQVTAAGVNHLDTAQFYGRCNDLIREALAPYPDDLVLVSKVGAERDGAGALIPAQRPEQLRAQVEANLATLGADRLDVVNLRRVDMRPGLVAQGDQRVDLDAQLAELTALRAAGKIGAIGLSHVTAGQLDQARPADIACVQNHYSVVDRSAEPVLEACRAHGIAWVPFFPLGGAFPGWPKAGDNQAVTTAATELGVTPGQVALAWLLARYDQTLLIPGTASPAHLAENLTVGSINLPPATRSALDALAPVDDGEQQ
jgi:pyridoxine 4-dehydrogenase